MSSRIAAWNSMLGYQVIQCCVLSELVRRLLPPVRRTDNWLPNHDLRHCGSFHGVDASRMYDPPFKTSVMIGTMVGPSFR